MMTTMMTTTTIETGELDTADTEFVRRVVKNRGQFDNCFSYARSCVGLVRQGAGCKFTH